MKAILWKEVRENLRWALLAAIGLGLAAALVHSQHRTSLSAGGPNPTEQLMPWLTFGAPLVGLMLGLAQILPEQRRDQWAFLVHRPVTRATLWAGKSAAGLLLYALATLVPLGAVTLWAKMPGHLTEPFYGQMTLPGLADILMGIAFYFAGMLTALRPARWYGSKALPIPLALLGSLFVLNVGEFWQAALTASVLILVFAVACWGSFRTTGEYQNQPRAAKICLGLSLYPGIVIVVLCIIALVVSFIPSAPYVYRPYTFYGISSHGQVLRVRAIDDMIMRAEDLSGREMRSLRGKNCSLIHENGGGQGGYVSHGPDASFRQEARFFRTLPSTYETVDTSTLWYYSYLEQRILGYSGKTRRLAEIGGPQGIVSAGQPRPAPFTGTPLYTDDYYNPSYDNRAQLTFMQAVYRLNLERRTITPYYIPVPPAQINLVAEVNTVNNPPEKLSGMSNIIIRSQQRVQVIDDTCVLLISMPRYLDTARYMEEDEVFTPDYQHYFFWYQETNKVPRKLRGKLPKSLIETDKHGRVLQRFSLPPLPVTRTADNSILPALAVPPVLIAVFGAGAALTAHRESTSFWSALYEGLTPHFYWGGFTLSALTGLLSAALALLIGKRCAWGRRGRVLWTLGAFWMGLYGVLLVLALDSWPARETCPNCKRKRIVTRETCEHCGAPFAVPAPDGTEIFDSVGV